MTTPQRFFILQIPTAPGEPRRWSTYDALTDEEGELRELAHADTGSSRDCGIGMIRATPT